MKMRLASSTAETTLDTESSSAYRSGAAQSDPATPNTKLEAFAARPARELEGPSVTEVALAIAAGLGKTDVVAVTSAWLVAQEIGLDPPRLRDINLTYGLTPFSPSLDFFGETEDISKYVEKSRADSRLAPFLRLGQVLAPIGDSDLEAMGRYVARQDEAFQGGWPRVDALLAKVRQALEAHAT